MNKAMTVKRQKGRESMESKTQAVVAAGGCTAVAIAKTQGENEAPPPQPACNRRTVLCCNCKCYSKCHSRNPLCVFSCQRFTNSVRQKNRYSEMRG
jgi:hypothetical protein